MRYIVTRYDGSIVNVESNSFETRRQYFTRADGSPIPLEEQTLNVEFFNEFTIPEDNFSPRICRRAVALVTGVVLILPVEE